MRRDEARLSYCNKLTKLSIKPISAYYRRTVHIAEGQARFVHNKVLANFSDASLATMALLVALKKSFAPFGGSHASKHWTSVTINS